MTMIRKMLGMITDDDVPERHEDAPERNDVYERCKEHELDAPENHVDHDAYWTGASGVFYCHTCEDWFRTWEVYD